MALPLYNYVPFYFNPRNAMLYCVENDGIIILLFGIKVATFNEAAFSNKNVACGDASLVIL